MKTGQIIKAYHVRCRKCTNSQTFIPDGVSNLDHAEQWVREAGWEKVGAWWMCKECVNASHT